MFEYYGNVHVYCPGVGADERLGSNFFQNPSFVEICPLVLEKIFEGFSPYMGIAAILVM